MFLSLYPGTHDFELLGHFVPIVRCATLNCTGLLARRDMHNQ